jgi:UDP-2,3-diacylglucosamine hydrolase
MIEKIAIIAGTGSLPLEASRSLLSQKKSFFIISLFPEENGDVLEKEVPNSVEVVKTTFAKAGTILKTLQKKNTTDVLFIGKVDKRNLLKRIKLDWLAIKFLAKLAYKSDKNIMEGLLQELSKHNIRVLKQHDVLTNLLVDPGILWGKLSPKLQEEIDYGMHIVNEISRCDIGQTVVVKDKMVLAVEAIEGTDNCIARGINIGKENVVICKGATATQNKKYDLPTLGPTSLEKINHGEVSVIAWKSTHTFIAEKERFIQMAKERGITLVSV